MKKTCPLCKKETDDKLIQTCVDAERWVIDQIRKHHPGWIAGDGSCAKCMEYYSKLGK